MPAFDFEIQNFGIEINGLFCIPWNNFHMVNSLEHHRNTSLV
jgi:hypothetical protein